MSCRESLSGGRMGTSISRNVENQMSKVPQPSILGDCTCICLDTYTHFDVDDELGDQLVIMDGTDIKLRWNTKIAHDTYSNTTANPKNPVQNS